MVRAAGSIVFGRLEEVPTKAVFICRVRVRGSADASAWILAVPATAEEEKARAVPMTGGDGEDLEQTGYTRLIALRNMDGWKTAAPKRAAGMRTWPDPESAPRLDALTSLVKAEEATPFDRRTAEFHYSDEAEPPTERESSDADALRRISARGTSWLEVVPEVGDASAELLREAAKLLGKPPKVSGTRSRRAHAEESAEGGRRGAERSKREGGDSRRRGEQLGRGSPSPSSGESYQSAARASRDARRSVERKRRSMRKGRGSPSPSERSSDESSSNSSRSSRSSRSSPRGRTRGRDRDRRDRRRKERLEKQKKKKTRRGGRSGSRSESSASGPAHAGRGSRKIASYEKLKKRFKKRPLGRWRHVEKLAAKAGYTGASSVELYLGECTKLGQARDTAYLAALLARIGHEAANGRPELAAGTAAAALGFLDTTYVQGETDLAWRTTLGEDPVAVTRNMLPNSQSLPEPGATPRDGASVAFAHRVAFSTLIPTRVMESTLEAAKQWKAWDKMTRQ